jgi:GT2 family glycosyltransferase
MAAMTEQPVREPSRDAADPGLTIIIVSWRVPEMLRECLRSIVEKGGLPVSSLQIIVVDNASGDGTIEMLRAEFPAVQSIASQINLGFGRANTLAWRHARAPLVLLLNPDTVVRDGALAAMVDRMQARGEIWALGCRLLNADGSLQRWTGGRFPTLWNVACHYLGFGSLLGPLGFDHSVYLTRDLDSDRMVDWVSGACLMLRRDRTPEPLFDPIFFMYGEDMDLCWRIRRAGGGVLYSPTASVVHFQGASIQQQSGDVLLTSLKGIRTFYARRAGPIRTHVFDALTVAGFALRWAAYTAAAALRPSGAWVVKAQSSRRHLQLALTLMRTAAG